MTIRILLADRPCLTVRFDLKLPSIVAKLSSLPLWNNTFFCQFCGVFLICLFEIIVRCFFPAGRNVIVWLDCSNKTPLLFLHAPSNFVPLDRSRTRNVECCPDCWVVQLHSLGFWKNPRRVYCQLVNCIRFLARLFLVCRLSSCGWVHSLWKKKISERPELSHFTIICLFAFMRSLIVVSKHSFFSVPSMISTGHWMRCIRRFWQNSLNRLLRRIVPGSVLITCGVPCLAV